MRIIKRTIWCLTGLLLASSASLAQNRAAGRHMVDQRQAMQDRFRAIRYSLSNPTRAQSSLPIQVDQANQERLEGASFVNIIPFVTKENGARTNIGINNFSQSSLAQEGRPTATVEISLYNPAGDLDRSGTFSVQSNEMLQINHIINVLDPVQGGGSATTGWLLIFSDEPVTAWASAAVPSAAMRFTSTHRAAPTAAASR